MLCARYPRRYPIHFTTRPKHSYTPYSPNSKSTMPRPKMSSNSSPRIYMASSSSTSQHWLALLPPKSRDTPVLHAKQLYYMLLKPESTIDRTLHNLTILSTSAKFWLQVGSAAGLRISGFKSWLFAKLISFKFAELRGVSFTLWLRDVTRPSGSDRSVRSQEKPTGARLWPKLYWVVHNECPLLCGCWYPWDRWRIACFRWLREIMDSIISKAEQPKWRIYPSPGTTTPKFYQRRRATCSI